MSINRILMKPQSSDVDNALKQVRNMATAVIIILLMVKSKVM